MATGATAVSSGSGSIGCAAPSVFLQRWDRRVRSTMRVAPGVFCADSVVRALEPQVTLHRCPSRRGVALRGGNGEV
eukprot:9710475-Lingulodinium_polyedra.AAC.1